MKALKGLGYWAGLLGLAVLMGTLAILAVYLLPTGRMKKNVAKSSYIFDHEEAYPELITGFAFTRLDNFTDSVMLGTAMYDGEGSLTDKAMSNYRMFSDKLNVIKSTSHYANDVKEVYYPKAYPWYWHGYLVYLKPLLLFFTYGEIRLLNGSFQTGLLILIIKLFLESRQKKYLPAFLVAILFLNPAATALSLQYSSMYYLLFFLTLLWLYWERKGCLTEKNIKLLAFGVGCATSYIDFLTYPAAGLGFLMVFYLNTFGFEPKKLIQYIKYVLLWVYGYVGMWAGKWLVSSLLLGRNMFTYGLDKIAERSAGEGNRFAGIVKNLEVYANKVFIILLWLAVTYAICRLVKEKSKFGKREFIDASGYLLTALLPFVWIFLASEHSNMHTWFVHRVFTVTLFALSCMFFRLTR